MIDVNASMMLSETKSKMQRVDEMYRPLFEHGKESELIDQNQLEMIYSWLPRFCRRNDPKLIYSSKIHGKNELFLQEKSKNVLFPLLFLLKFIIKTKFSNFREKYIFCKILIFSKLRIF